PGSVVATGGAGWFWAQGGSSNSSAIIISFLFISFPHWSAMQLSTEIPYHSRVFAGCPGIFKAAFLSNTLRSRVIVRGDYHCFFEVSLCRDVLLQQTQRFCPDSLTAITGTKQVISDERFLGRHVNIMQQN